MKDRLPVDISGQDGASLMTVLVGLAIVGILMGVVSTFAVNSMSAAQAINRIGEQEDIRRLIRIRMDCTQTKSRVPRGNSNVVLYGRDGNPIMQTNPNNEMKVDKWTVVASAYNATTGQFTIHAAHPKSPRQPLFKFAPLVCAP